MTEISWSMVKRIAKGYDLSLQLDLMDYRLGDPDAEAMCSLIERAIDSCAESIARFPKEHGPMGEDQLTVTMLMQLQKLGLDATHDSMSGGHCDIVIEEPDGFLWLGEVKKVDGVNNSWVADGYDQLTLRYSTGLPYQNRGSLIVFCNCERIDRVLESWSAFLTGRYEHSGVSITEYNGEAIWFRSEHPGIKTGLIYHVRHKPISIFFPPQHGLTSERSKGNR
jgi:hypothetical protein